MAQGWGKGGGGNWSRRAPTLQNSTLHHMRHEGEYRWISSRITSTRFLAMISRSPVRAMPTRFHISLLAKCDLGAADTNTPATEDSDSAAHTDSVQHWYGNISIWMELGQWGLRTGGQLRQISTATNICKHRLPCMPSPSRGLSRMERTCHA